MRRNPTRKIEQYRVTSGPNESRPADGANGAFQIPCAATGTVLRVVVSNGAGWHASGLPEPVWEHVSVSLPARCPTWNEMDFIKRLFWRDDETVIQLHVPREQHVNVHQNCLHLWRPLGAEVLVPPMGCV